MASSPNPWWAWGCRGQMTARDLRNMLRLNLWLLAWMATLLAATFLIRRDVVQASPWNALVALVPNLPAAVVFWTYVRFLRGADELLRKIHLESMALAFGVGVLFMFGYRLLERIGLPTLDVSDPVLPMMITNMVSHFIAARRYR